MRRWNTGGGATVMAISSEEAVCVDAAGPVLHIAGRLRRLETHLLGACDLRDLRRRRIIPLAVSARCSPRSDRGIAERDASVRRSPRCSRYPRVHRLAVRCTSISVLSSKHRPAPVIVDAADENEWQPRRGQLQELVRKRGQEWPTDGDRIVGGSNFHDLDRGGRVTRRIRRFDDGTAAEMGRSSTFAVARCSTPPCD